MNSMIPLLLAGTLLVSPAAAAEAIPDPFELVELASARVADAGALSFHVEKRYDVILADGAKVEFSGALDVVSRRSKGLFMDYGDDLSSKRVWYDGETMILLDELTNLYVETPVEGTVAEALAGMAREHGVEMPLGSLLQESLVEQLEGRRSSYLGIHDADGDPCHHLLFRGERADAQIWITTGDEPLLRKLVVTFWDILGSPQQSLTFSDWDLNAKIKRNVFKAQLPDGARAIEFLPVGGE